MIVLQYVLDALSLGSLIALAAIGVALTFSVMRLVNLAHGEFVMVSAYSLIIPSSNLAITLLLGRLPLWLATLAVMGVGGLVALGTERIAFRPLRNADPTTLLISSFAVSYLLQQSVRSIYGSEPKSVGIGEVLNQSLTFGALRVSLLDISVLGIAMLILGLLRQFLQHGRWGVQMRAAAEDFMMARLLGIPANRVIACAFFLSGSLAGVVAVVLTVKTGTLSPTMGVNISLLAFVAVVVGGMGSLLGAVCGAYLIGAISVALQTLLPERLRGMQEAFVFLAIIAVLLFRPQGLSGTAESGTRV
jgi:branched-chain amino acid transport system permease protein